ANGPDRLVCNDNLAPILDNIGNRLQLSSDNLQGDALFTLLQGLAAAEDDGETGIKGRLCLGCNEFGGLLEDGAALRVAENNPWDLGVGELLGRDFTSVGTVALVEDVLGSDFDLGADELGGEEEIKGRRRDDDLCGGR